MSKSKRGMSDELHTLFGVLREHVVDVVDDFQERVYLRVEELSSERFESPSIFNVLISSIAQGLNILTPSSDEEEPGDKDE